ncbi:hypothetical protein ACLF3G_28345 [Falsiroseomonas sp. HC035]|uniref:hypothetical protein n=1 Tax=Falsiroseomonas sp. HC035 TaxID=3390999 RepID=UPI003D31372C
MMAAGDWELQDDGCHICIPIWYEDAAEVRQWCADNCEGEYLISLGRTVVFQYREDAALAALWWQREER